MTFIHLAKRTSPSAGRPHQQKGRRFLSVTLCPVRTSTFFADGVDIPLFDNSLDSG